MPLTGGLEDEVIFATPSELAGMLQRDELDTAMVSLTEVLLKGRYDVLDGIAIVSLGEVWVTLDENTVGLNDAGFAVAMTTPKWVDYVGYYHGNACGFSFLDGHSEIHKWTDSRTIIPKLNGQVPAGTLANPSLDWVWISQHTSGRG